MKALLLIFLFVSWPGTAAVLQLEAGAGHTCTLFDDGRAKCWGRNGWGEAGMPLTQIDTPREANFLFFGDKKKIVKLSTGDRFTCAILEDKSARCWGWNEYGQLGRPTAGGREEPHTVPALDVPRSPVQISAGGEHACALLDDDSVYCWGTLSPGTIVAKPTKVLLKHAPVFLASGERFSCGLTAKGEIYCWGYGGNGQLGIGNTAEIKTWDKVVVDRKVELGTGRKALSLTVTRYSACALLDNKKVKCWGDGGLGRIGNGSTSGYGYTPDSVGDKLPYVDVGDLDVESVHCGLGNHCCTIFEAGTMKCWGWNDSGQLGYFKREGLGDQPGEMGDDLPYVDLGRLRSVRKVALGGAHTCAELDDDSVRCWGYLYGALNGFNFTPLKMEF